MRTVIDAIAEIRDGNSALRQVSRNGGRTGATTSAIGRHQRRIAAAEAALLASGHRHLVGHLVEEANLARRLMGSRKSPRPELSARARVERARIKNYTDRAGEMPLADII